MSDLKWGPVAAWCQISLSADRPSFPAAESVVVTVVLRNVSGKPAPYQPYPFAPGVDYKVSGADGSATEMTTYGRLMRDSAGVSSSAVETLAPGQDVVYEVLLSRVYDLTVPGIYHVEVGKTLDVQGRPVIARSNVLELEIQERD